MSLRLQQQQLCPGEKKMEPAESNEEPECLISNTVTITTPKGASKEKGLGGLLRKVTTTRQKILKVLPPQRLSRKKISCLCHPIWKKKKKKCKGHVLELPGSFCTSQCANEYICPLLQVTAYNKINMLIF